MAHMGFCDKHNMVAFLQKPSRSEDFHQIVDFLAGSHIRKGEHVPLFDTMLLHNQPGQGEGPTLSIESQHTPTASSPSTLQPTTSQPTSSQAHSSHEPTTEPIITTSSPHLQETQIP
ncbi:hypothetical protein Tco_0266421 [Tanacetum coccineum]